MRNPHKLPRRAYCTGCGYTFPKHHMLINHRRSERCGGRFLPEDEYLHLMNLRKIREDMARAKRKNGRKEPRGLDTRDLLAGMYNDSFGAG